MHYLKFGDMLGFIFIDNPQNVKTITGFKPIADQHAKILILGSMPSEESLRKQQYYGHARNAFWRIMLSILQDDSTHEMSEYSQRKNCLIINNIAVWDVLQRCYRSGSLDSAIKMDSIKTNDFLKFFKQHPTISKVCFNGAKAEAIYLKAVLPTVKEQFNHLNYVKLPSTSPAYAAMSLQQKMAIWKKEIKDHRL